MTYRQEFIDGASPWVLYDDMGRSMTRFTTRRELLDWCRNTGFEDVKWTPSWVRPTSGRIRGHPVPVGLLRYLRKDEFS